MVGEQAGLPRHKVLVLPRHTPSPGICRRSSSPTSRRTGSSGTKILKLDCINNIFPIPFLSLRSLCESLIISNINFLSKYFLYSQIVVLPSVLPSILSILSISIFSFFTTVTQGYRSLRSSSSDNFRDNPLVHSTDAHGIRIFWGRGWGRILDPHSEKMDLQFRPKVRQFQNDFSNFWKAFSKLFLIE